MGGFQVTPGKRHSNSLREKRRLSRREGDINHGWTQNNTDCWMIGFLDSCQIHNRPSMP
jgi:hypothetical protein